MQRAEGEQCTPDFASLISTPVFCGMTSGIKTVSYLKKLRLLFQAGTSSQSSDLTSGAVEMELVFGVGSRGLTPFEAQLSDKPVGYLLDVQLPPGGVHPFFGHIFPPFRRLPDQLGTTFLHVQIVDITDAESQEVVKALAEVANCGDHCCGH